MWSLFLKIYVSFFATAYAHPVTFEDGIMLKSMFREDMSESSVTYSFHRLMAAGLEADTMNLNGTDTTWILAEWNARPFRWNAEHSQANVYLLTAGGAFNNRWVTEWASKAGVQIDYETRQFFIMGKHQEWWSENLNTRMSMMQIGFAPFVAGYKDLHIWSLVQFDYNPDMRRYIQVTPFLRFFYKNVYWEAGASTRGNFYGQFMVHI
jgi:hypothetical protein